MRTLYGLIESLISDPKSFTDYNELLSATWKSNDLTFLDRLLHSSDETIVSAALFLAEELGNRATGRVRSLSDLCCHRSPSIRVKAIHALAACLTDETCDFMATLVAAAEDDKDFGCRVSSCYELMKLERAIFEKFMIKQASAAGGSGVAMKAENSRAIIPMISAMNADSDLLREAAASRDEVIGEAARRTLKFLSLRKGKA